MSTFHFAKPDLPRQVGTTALVGGVGLMSLIAVTIVGLANDRRAAIADKQALITRAETLGTDSARGLSNDAFFSGDTPQLAQAALQTDLQALAESHRIDVEMIRADEIEQIDGLVRLNLTINGVAPEVELGSFLTGLATMEPIVIVEDLSLRPARTSRTNPERRIAFTASLYGAQRP